jgi:two-component system CheB/CheR fusion protein
LRELLQETAERAKTFQDFLVEHQFPEIGFKRMLLNGRIFREERGESRILLAIDDVTDSAGAGKG